MECYAQDQRNEDSGKEIVVIVVPQQNSYISRVWEVGPNNKTRLLAKDGPFYELNDVDRHLRNHFGLPPLYTVPIHRYVSEERGCPASFSIPSNDGPLSAVLQKLLEETYEEIYDNR